MKVMRLFILGFLALGLCACGTKGRLKSPSQIEAAEAKKKAKAEKKADREADQEGEDTSPPVIEGRERGDTQANQPNALKDSTLPTSPPQGER